MPTNRLRCLSTLASCTVLAAGLLAGCRSDDDQVAAVSGPDAMAIPVVSASAPFCDALDRITAAKEQGFSALRQAPVGDSVWIGALVPPGLSGCSVVGNRTGTAQYICWGPTVPDRAALPRLEPQFAQTVALVDACLQGRGGFSRGSVLRFAGGERLAVWRAPAASPSPGVTVRIEENTATGAYALTLSGVTLR